MDISGLSVSIKGGSFASTFPIQGGTILPARGYAIIGSMVSSATKFLQDYSSYNGVLLRSSISLVNTGITSIDLKLNGSYASPGFMSPEGIVIYHTQANFLFKKTFTKDAEGKNGN